MFFSARRAAEITESGLCGFRSMELVRIYVEFQ